MRILQVLYYYEPYISGLTIYGARLAHGMRSRGHSVRVICARHDSSLPQHEVTDDGIEIQRLRVLTRFDRAVILPGLIPAVLATLQDIDVVHLHLPMAETAIIVALCRIRGKRVVVTHHADLVLQGGPVARMASSVARISSQIGGRLANAFVTNTEARASVSPVARLMRRNLRVIPPPIEIQLATFADGQQFREERGWSSVPVVGFVGRYTSEKGIEILLQTVPLLRMRYPEAIIALAGPNTDPRTGEPRRGPWDVWLDRYDYGIQQLGELSDQDLSRFYAAMDVLVLPSIDWTESFGMVQIEAMMHGTPVIASDLPGVSDPVRYTGGGRIVSPGNVRELASAIGEVLSVPERYQPDASVLAHRYSLESVLTSWEQVYAGEE